MISYPTPTHMEYPKPIVDSIETLQSFTASAREVSMYVLNLS
jgi:hypothetical protein